MKRTSNTRSHGTPRRTLLKGALSATALWALPRGARAQPKKIGPNEKVNLACVGIGGRGAGVTQSLAGTGLANVVAVCDVALGDRTRRIQGKYPKAKAFKDFRQMFDKMAGEIDAVSIAIPDHSHFPVAMLSMSLGKHIYVEKPLAHTFQEIELMMAAEKKYNVACQMGNQGHSGNNPLQFEAWVKAGIIKNVKRVDAFMNSARRWHGWKIDGYPTGEKKPPELDWDLWLATAQERPYSSKLHPGNWRSWYDFGNGAFGDWGPHTLDTVHRYLNCGLPEKITAVKRDGPNKWIFPQASTIAFDFPARGTMPPLRITWYDGTKNPAPRPDELDKGRNLGRHGKVIYGEGLTFHGGTHSSTLRIIPEAKMRDMKSKLPKITEKHSNHFANLLLGAKGVEKTRSSFDVSGPLTQVFLLGVIAQRLGGVLEFDRKTKQITNNKLANQLLAGPPPRKGWEQFYKM